MARARQIRANLLGWYDRHARALPWRGTAPDAYRTWLSEIMLQQTTVAHATPYFLAFTARWPTLAALAAARDEEVMAAWAGLGYYARARNLLACARRIASDFGGDFPRSEAALRALPGVGGYTAAAIAAIAFDQPANAVDANVERVVARLFAVETPLPPAKGELNRLAASLVRDDRPGDWAQALMDLGALICRPKAPLCGQCPLATQCRARESGDAETWPRRSAKPARPHRHGVAYILTCGDTVALSRRPPRGLLGGMFGLPTTQWRVECWSEAEALAGAPRPGDWRPVGSIEHMFTHFSLSMAVYQAAAAKAGGDFHWMRGEEARVVTPTVFRKALCLFPCPTDVTRVD